MRPKIAISQQTITEFCRKWKIVEFSLFGSVLRDDFRPESDIDVLVRFAADAQHSLSDLILMQEELRNLFGREVDIVVKETLERSRNYLRRKAILGEAEVIYAE
ncbi:MAG: nucleotidyltransferase domain-containing protein [Fimbriimonadales bacterium]